MNQGHLILHIGLEMSNHVRMEAPRTGLVSSDGMLRWLGSTPETRNLVVPVLVPDPVRPPGREPDLPRCARSLTLGSGRRRATTCSHRQQGTTLARDQAFQIGPACGGRERCQVSDADACMLMSPELPAFRHAGPIGGSATDRVTAAQGIPRAARAKIGYRAARGAEPPRDRPGEHIRSPHWINNRPRHIT